MTTVRFTPPLMAATILVVSAVTTGCSRSTVPSPYSTAASPRPVASEIPALANTVDKTLPIEAYLFSGEQREQLDAARDTLVAQCMKRFGFAYTPSARSVVARGQATHRYDVVDPANGYRSPDRSLFRPAPPPISPDMAAVLGGGPPGGPQPTATYNGTTIPSGGCVGEVDRKLTAQGGTIGDSDLAVSINFDNYERSITDERVKSVFRQWSDCMKAMGFSYSTPIEAMKDKRWLTRDTASPEEVATATTDSTCRQKYNIIGTWFTVESAYETQGIQAKIHELTQVKQGMDAVLKNAATVAATGSL